MSGSAADPPRPASGLFVTGTDTDVGKTYVATRIVRAFAEQGRCVGVYKPACSGAVRDDVTGGWQWDDVEQLRHSTGAMPPPTEVVSPQRFRAPLAPPAAAAAEGRTVDAELLHGGAAVWAGRCDLLVVEGAGGLLAPLAETVSCADLAVAFGYPLVVVARNRLGTINHTLLTLEACARRSLRVAAVVLSDGPIPVDDPSRETNAEDVRRLAAGVPVVTLGGEAAEPIDANGDAVSWCDLLGEVAAERFRTACRTRRS